MADDLDPDRPLVTDQRFLVEVARFVDGRPDPGQNTTPPGNPPLDVIALLERQEQLDRVVG